MQQEPTIPHPSEQYTKELPPIPEADNPIVSKPKQRKHESLKSAFTTIGIVIAAPLLALLLINYVFQSYEVDGPSMQQTLQNADKLIVWKAPRTISRIRHTNYVPGRGEIIVFVKHGLYDSDRGIDKQLIKRVIGVPGDRVVVNDGHITIYNDDNPQGFDPDKEGGWVNNLSYTNGNVDITVNEGEVFVCGDNRSNSLDSRVFGSVHSNDIVGTLEFRIFPFNQFDKF